jgi:hypothetical protein
MGIEQVGVGGRPSQEASVTGPLGEFARHTRNQLADGGINQRISLGSGRLECTQGADSPASASAPHCSVRVATSMPWLERRDHRGGMSTLYPFAALGVFARLLSPAATGHRFDGAGSGRRAPPACGAGLLRPCQAKVYAVFTVV